MRKSYYVAALVCFSVVAGTASAQYIRFTAPSIQYRAPTVVPQYQQPMIQPYAGATPMYSQPYSSYAPPQVYRPQAPQYTYQAPRQYLPPVQSIEPYAGATAMYPQPYMYSSPPVYYFRW